MTFGSLFAGIGGFDLGLERAGMHGVWQVENDRHCVKLLTERWPTVQRFADVRDVGTNLAPVDLVVGGFPCQDVSVAGLRAGLAGERSGLWWELHRILGVARPQWVVIENVPGLYSVDEGRGFAAVVSGLVGLGYRVTWRRLDAQYFGLAQRRKRVFLVGHLGDGAAASVLLESPGMSGDPATRRAPREGTAPTLEARTRGGGQPGSDFAANGGVIPVDLAQVTSAVNRIACEPGAPAYPLASSGIPAVAYTVASKWAKGTGGPAGDEVQNLVADPISAVEGRTYTHEGDTFRLHNVVAGVRRLTPTECERLQGFPDGWTAGYSDSTRYRMLGNAVAVPVAEWLGRRILAQTAPEGT